MTSPYPAPQWQPPAAAPAPRRERRWARTLTGLAVVGVLAGGTGGGTVYALGRLDPQPAAVASPFGSSSSVPAAHAATAEGVLGQQVASAVGKSVVSILVRSGQGGGEGTGVVLDEQGHVVTNNHVVSGAGQDARVRVAVANEQYDATVVGTDPSTDLAVIKITDPPQGLAPITFADSSTVQVGDAVLAVGNPLGLSGTVTTGIVSAVNRPVVTQQVSGMVSDGGGTGNVYTSAIQTSAAINPGNSGGALVDAAGRLIGINSSIASVGASMDGQSGNIGIGFAIPANQVKDITGQLIDDGTAQHAFLGISTRDGNATVGSATTAGAEVMTVQDGAPAAQAGLQRGDLVTAVDGVPVGSSDALVAQVRSYPVGHQVTITVVRSGAEQELTADLGTAPPSASQPSSLLPFGR